MLRVDEIAARRVLSWTDGFAEWEIAAREVT